LAALKKLLETHEMGWLSYPLKSTNSRGLKVLSKKGVLRFCGHKAPPSAIRSKGKKALMAHNAMGLAFQNRMPGWTFGAILNPVQKLLHRNPRWLDLLVVFGKDRLVFVRRQRASNNPKVKQGTGTWWMRLLAFGRNCEFVECPAHRESIFFSLLEGRRKNRKPW
jgi:hypothetical protein